MRQSRSPYTKESDNKKSNKPKIFAVIVVLGILVYILSSGTVGKFISDQIITPVANFFTGEESEQPQVEESPSPSPSATESEKEGQADSQNVVSKTIELPQNAYFALQMGVFNNEQNAQDAAEQLRQQGGAGYILEDGGQYRVLMSAYHTQEEAQTVKERLQSEGMDTSIYEFTSAATSFNVKGAETYVVIIQEVFGSLPTLIDEVYNLSIALDQGQMDLEAANESLSTLITNINEQNEQLGTIGSNSDNEVVGSLLSAVSSTKQLLDIAAKATTVAEMSTQLKYVQIQLIDQYLGVIGQIE